MTNRWMPDVFLRLLERPREEQHQIEQTATLVAYMPELGTPIPGSQGLLFVDARLDHELARLVYRVVDDGIVTEELLFLPLSWSTTAVRCAPRRRPRLPDPGTRRTRQQASCR